MGDGGGSMIIQQNPHSPILVNHQVWHWRLERISLVGGLHHLVLGNTDIDQSFVTVTDCSFANASGTVVRTDPHFASAQVTISRSEFIANQQIALNWCTWMTFVDIWVEGCGPVDCSADTALFENRNGLFLERMVGVPEAKKPSARQRWIDNIGHEATLSARDTRFGGEGGGMLVLLNRASFLCVPNGTGCDNPPGSGPLPKGTRYNEVPEGSSIIFDNCQIDSFQTTGPGQPSIGNASIVLEQLPQVLIVRQSLGLAFAPAFYSPALSLVAVSPSLDLDGPQLGLAARTPRTLRYSLGPTNDWAPPSYMELPEQ